MANFAAWCDTADKTADAAQGTLHVLTTDEERVGDGIAAMIEALPTHYILTDEWDIFLEVLDQPALRARLAQEMPAPLNLRSGDLGEIFGTAYIEERTDFSLTVRKLRYSPTRRTPMKGDDLLAFRFAEDGGVDVLKGEAKSSADLREDVIVKAREKLDEFDGGPDVATFSFLARIIRQEGNADAANAILRAQLKGQILPERVTHMIFTFTGNDPTTLLQADIEKPLAVAARTHVGLHVETHQNFIKSVFAGVLGDDA